MEEQILRLFLFNEKLKFSEIEKLLKTRSNKLAYHIKQLVKKGVLIKDRDFYLLSQSSEYLIPYISEKKSPLPCVLIHIGNDKNCFLYLREKRPFKGKLSLPGGRMRINESFEEATKRIMKEKFNVNVKFEKINSISLEYIKKNKKIVHSLLLFFISAKTKDKLKFIEINKNKSKIISSDYNLIIKDSKLRPIKINKLYSLD